MEPDGSGSGPSAPGRPGGSARPSAGVGSGEATTSPVMWVIGAVIYCLEVAVLAVICLLIGGLSAMLADTCFPGSTELICEPRWQNITALTPITALVVTVLVMGALVLWRRRMWALITAMVVTPIVPLVAFLFMQEVVTA